MNTFFGTRPRQAVVATLALVLTVPVLAYSAEPTALTGSALGAAVDPAANQPTPPG